MAVNLRVVVSHLDSNGKVLTNFGIEQFIVTAATADENGIATVLNNNSKKRGSRVLVHSYAILDKEHAVAANLLT